MGAASIRATPSLGHQTSRPHHSPTPTGRQRHDRGSVRLWATASSLLPSSAPCLVHVTAPDSLTCTTPSPSPSTSPCRRVCPPPCPPEPSVPRLCHCPVPTQKHQNPSPQIATSRRTARLHHIHRLPGLPIIAHPPQRRQLSSIYWGLVLRPSPTRAVPTAHTWAHRHPHPHPTPKLAAPILSVHQIAPLLLWIATASGPRRCSGRRRSRRATTTSATDICGATGSTQGAQVNLRTDAPTPPPSHCVRPPAPAPAPTRAPPPTATGVIRLPSHHPPALPTRTNINIPSSITTRRITTTSTLITNRRRPRRTARPCTLLLTRTCRSNSRARHPAESAPWLPRCRRQQVLLLRPLRRHRRQLPVRTNIIRASRRCTRPRPTTLPQPLPPTLILTTTDATRVTPRPPGASTIPQPTPPRSVVSPTRGITRPRPPPPR